MIPTKYFRRGYTMLQNIHTYPAYDQLGSVYEAPLAYYGTLYENTGHSTLHVKRKDQLIALSVSRECENLTIKASLKTRSPLNWYMVNDELKTIIYSIGNRK